MKNKASVVQDVQQEKKKGGYGLLSLMAMIIGIVIGSGIFAKNAGLIATAGSSTMVAMSWLLGALIIITMVIAFLEIISVTEITGEQATITNWGRRLVGIRFGKFAGVYFTLLYFPVLLAGLFQIASDSLLHTISYAVTPDHTDSWYTGLNSIAFEGALITVALILLMTIMAINALMIKPGKYFQNLGTAVKTIPLIFIIVIFIMMIGSGDLHFATNDELFNGTDSSGIKWDNGFTDNPLDGASNAKFLALMATMPAVLFSFDGFLLAGNLSREAKKPTTFRAAFIFSIIFIIVIYLLYSMAILGMGDYTTDEHGTYGSISNAIYSVYDDDVAAIIDPTVTTIITISILTGVSGCSITSYRAMADLSTQNIIRDENGEILEKNKSGINANGAFIMIGMSMVWFFIGSMFDTYLTTTGDGGPLSVVGFSLDMIIVWAYFIYTIVIVFAMLNRFTKKTLVHKRLLFWPAALITTICTFVITVEFAMMVLLPGDTGMSDPVWKAKMIYTVIFFIVFALIYIRLGLLTGKTTARVEATSKMIAKAEEGNKSAIRTIEAFQRKDAYTAAYYGITVEQLHKEREGVHLLIEEEKLKRKEAHDTKHDKHYDGISDKEAKRRAKAEVAAEKDLASSKAYDKKAAKAEAKKAKADKKLLKDVDYSVKAVAPKSK